MAIDDLDNFMEIDPDYDLEGIGVDEDYLTVDAYSFEAWREKFCTWDFDQGCLAASAY